MNAPTLESYRRIGPFSNETLPKGLLSEHSLKAGSWARLEVRAGSIRFVWDDTGEGVVLGEGAEQLIPPLREHHLELAGEFSLEIEFLREI